MHVSLQNIGILYGKLPIRSLGDIICNKNPYPKLYFKYHSSLKNLFMTKKYLFWLCSCWKITGEHMSSRDILVRPVYPGLERYKQNMDNGVG